MFTAFIHEYTSAVETRDNNNTVNSSKNIGNADR
jgi:hypothetical protein